ncbi:MAG: 50S ribosomal protein L5 [Verrucomicrobiales bacterium]
MIPALQKHYKEHVIPALQQKLGYKNVHQIPRIEKVIINCSVGKEADRKVAVEDASADLARITGQRPVVTRSKIAISNFKLRAGEPIGVKVTLRGRNMYEFLERLVRVAIPVIRDFRGVSTRSFDGRGNYTLGIKDHTIFPEIELDKIKRNMGYDISIVTTANNDNEARELLREFGVPFRRSSTDQQAA